MIYAALSSVVGVTKHGETTGGAGVYLDGYVITNFHVATLGTFVKLKPHREAEHIGEVIWSDRLSDLALIRTEWEGDYLPRAPNTMPGMEVYTIGSPNGFHHTVSKGVISATGVTPPNPKNGMFDLLQTDALVTKGSSGGGLFGVDSAGEPILLGIVQSFVPDARIGFAIPISTVLRVITPAIKELES